jgi:hypothetical protein
MRTPAQRRVRKQQRRQRKSRQRFRHILFVEAEETMDDWPAISPHVRTLSIGAPWPDKDFFLKLRKTDALE